MSGGLTAECFHLALEARELDMRASPYDLRGYGYEPIPVELPEGRKTYQRLQAAVSEKGRRLATKLIHELHQAFGSRATA